MSIPEFDFLQNSHLLLYPAFPGTHSDPMSLACKSIRKAVQKEPVKEFLFCREFSICHKLQFFNHIIAHNNLVAVRQPPCKFPRLCGQKKIIDTKILVSSITRKLIPPYFFPDPFHVILHFFLAYKARFFCFSGKSFFCSFKRQHCGIFKIESALYWKSLLLPSFIILSKIAA